MPLPDWFYGKGLGLDAEDVPQMLDGKGTIQVAQRVRVVDQGETMVDDSEKGIGILDVKAALEDVFKGCTVSCPPTMMGSFHAEVKFDEYEIRVILVGRRSAEKRDMHFRFMQKLRPPQRNRKPIKVVLVDLKTQDEHELLQAIKGVKEYLMGIVHSINFALKRKPVLKVRDIDDLFKGD